MSLRIKLFLFVASLFAIYSNYVRFTNTNLTETELFLKIVGLL